MVIIALLKHQLRLRAVVRAGAYIVWTWKRRHRQASLARLHAYREDLPFAQIIPKIVISSSILWQYKKKKGSETTQVGVRTVVPSYSSGRVGASQQGEGRNNRAVVHGSGGSGGHEKVGQRLWR